MFAMVVETEKLHSAALHSAAKNAMPTIRIRTLYDSIYWLQWLHII